MRNSTSVLNLSGIECWMVNLLPFDDAHRWDKNVLPFQMHCIKKGIFGIGWYNDITDYGNMTPESIQHYLSDYIGAGKLESSHMNAIARFSEIKVGHYVVMRLRNAHYYIGKVDEAPRYNNGIDPYEAISWYCHVEQWIEFENEENLPSEIIGRFSQQLQPTIVRIGSIRQKLLIIQAYVNRSGIADRQIGEIPKIRLSVNNFSRSLNYRELEDLVCAYIYFQNKGYMLLPSSCKNNHLKYECTFVKAGCKPITCQVKNQTELPDIATYIGDTSYAKIYLFSGILTDEQVEECKSNYSAYKHLVFISPSELYTTLLSFDYFMHKMEAFYTPSEHEVKMADALKAAGWREARSFRGKDKNCFKVYTVDISLGSNDIYYSNELNSIVYTGPDYESDLPYINRVISIVDKEGVSPL